MVKIRLARRGRKKLALYDIVVADSRSPRDGKFIEKLGTYNPNKHPHEIVLNSERALYWIMVGAEATDTARSLLSREGVMLRKHLQVGVKKGAISQEQADEKFNNWKAGKDAAFAAELEAKKRAAQKAKEELASKAKALREAKEKEAAEAAAQTATNAETEASAAE
jgi:small subunit ribosomal protein S16